MFKKSILLISLISIFLLFLSCAPISKPKVLKTPLVEKNARECVTQTGSICSLDFPVSIGERCVCREFLIFFGEGFPQDSDGIAR